MSPHGLPKNLASTTSKRHGCGLNPLTRVFPSNPSGPQQREAPPTPGGWAACRCGAPRCPAARARASAELGPGAGRPPALRRFRKMLQNFPCPSLETLEVNPEHTDRGLQRGQACVQTLLDGLSAGAGCEVQALGSFRKSVGAPWKPDCCKTTRGTARQRNATQCNARQRSAMCYVAELRHVPVRSRATRSHIRRSKQNPIPCTSAQPEED